ncbi:YbhB/YbcL family Raf kinase inhibitor-like protein [Naumannella halotolerans]|uniref:YbhB/YbcL family Raf kinase inhibitor-like protein n=1 Tax=Naumannella halotolerans TaxID=993414 RepID=UPI00370DB08A
MNLERPVAPNPYEILPQVGSFTLTSETFSEGDTLAAPQTASGGSVAPQLSWSGFPEGTKSFLISCFDPDAPVPGGFWHWAVVGVPASVTSLPLGGALPEGALALPNSGGEEAYMGAAPPPGDRAHRYIFAVNALDTEFSVDPGTTPTVAHFQSLGNLLARATLTGTYAEPDA